MSTGKEIAESRRRSLKTQLEKQFGFPQLAAAFFRQLFGLDFPSALSFLPTDEELVVGIDQDDKREAKVKYEIDNWGFVLFGKLRDKGINHIHFVIKKSSTYDLCSEKWFVLFIKRLSFMNHHAPKGFPHKVSLLDNNGILEPYPIPGWTQKSVEEYTFYLPEALADREEKSKHNQEQTLQWKLNKILKNKRPASLFCLEYPCYVILQGQQKKKLSIDLIEFGEEAVRIFEVKHKGNKDLEGIPQSLDYLIFIRKLWSKISQSKDVPNTSPSICFESYLAAPNKHPLFDDSAKMYGEYGFDIQHYCIKED